MTMRDLQNVIDSYGGKHISSDEAKYFISLLADDLTKLTKTVNFWNGALTFVIIYLLLSFIGGSVDYAKWGKVERIAFVVLVIVWWVFWPATRILQPYWFM